MSRYLPEKPNLEYLRKQAKDLLRKMHERDPALKLVDAQHALAREYGFQSWPRLKAQVESILSQAGSSARSAARESAVVDDNPSATTDQVNPFVGTWKANLARSKQHPLNQFQAATLHFAVAGDLVTITDVVVDSSGHEGRAINKLQPDGREHLSEGGQNRVVFARWVGSHILQAAVKKDGQVEGRVTYEVSADTTLLTISTEHQVIVCERG